MFTYLLSCVYLDLPVVYIRLSVVDASSFECVYVFVVLEDCSVSEVGTKRRLRHQQRVSWIVIVETRSYRTTACEYNSGCYELFDCFVVFFTFMTLNRPVHGNSWRRVKVCRGDDSRFGGLV